MVNTSWILCRTVVGLLIIWSLCRTLCSPSIWPAVAHMMVPVGGFLMPRTLHCKNPVSQTGPPSFPGQLKTLPTTVPYWDSSGMPSSNAIATVDDHTSHGARNQDAQRAAQSLVLRLKTWGFPKPWFVGALCFCGLLGLS